MILNRGFCLKHWVLEDFDRKSCHPTSFRMKVTEYDLNKSQEKARLTNIDVEMDGVQENKGTEEERMLDDVDYVEVEQPEEKDKIWTDEDEKMNNNETKKIPCSKYAVFFFSKFFTYK